MIGNVCGCTDWPNNDKGCRKGGGTADNHLISSAHSWSTYMKYIPIKYVYQGILSLGWGLLLKFQEKLPNFQTTSNNNVFFCRNTNSSLLQRHAWRQCLSWSRLWRWSGLWFQDRLKMFPVYQGVCSLWWFQPWSKAQFFFLNSFFIYKNLDTSGREHREKGHIAHQCRPSSKW